MCIISILGAAESFRDKNNMSVVVLHQWEELGFPFHLRPSHPPHAPLLCIAGESPLLDDYCSAESALWWQNLLHQSKYTQNNLLNILCLGMLICYLFLSPRLIK